MGRRTPAVLASLTALLALLAACSSSAGSPASKSPSRTSAPSATGADPFAVRPKDGTALATAMDEVSGSGPASTYFEFGDIAGLRALGVNPTSQSASLAVISDWGASALSGSLEQLPGVIGVNFPSVDTAITVGEPPNVAFRFDGKIDAATVRAKLTKLGAKPRTFDSVSGLSFGADNSINYQGPIVTQLQLQSQLDQLVVTPHGIAGSPNVASLARVLGTGPSLLHTGDDAQLATCLGDAIAATVLTNHADRVASGYGLAVERPTSGDDPLQEVLCIRPRPGKQAAVHATLAQRLALSAHDPPYQVSMSQIIADSTVTDVGHFVRVTVTNPPAQPPWMMRTGLNNHEVAYWDGSCSAAAMAQAQC